jgi:hypothetical protein
MLLRRDRDDARRWYRCVSRWSIDCRATACFEVASNVITQLSCNHNHSPPIFTASVRLLVIVGWTSYLGHYPWVTVFGVTLVFYIFVTKWGGKSISEPKWVVNVLPSWFFLLMESLLSLHAN